MKINPNYKIRKIATLTVVVNQGTSNINMTRLISLNKSARFLYESLSDREFGVEDAAELLMERYGLEREKAMEDAQKWVDCLKECGVLEDE